MKKGLVLIVALLFVISLSFTLTSCEMFEQILGNGQSSGSSGTSDGSKQIPVYRGMTITSVMTADYAGAYGNGNNGNGNNGNNNGNNGNHYGQYKGDHTDNDKDVDSENPFPDNAPDDNIEEEIISSLKVVGSSQDIYCTTPSEDVYINIHISNPDSFEILSFTLNGQKYSSYMFEKGSNMETIILKCNVGDVRGIVEYTIDAIKYIDGTEIKDVIIAGDQTVKVGIKIDNQVTANITDLDSGTNALAFNVSITDSDELIAQSNGKLIAVIYDGEELVAEQVLQVGNNYVLFDNLQTNTLYQYSVVGFYDDLSGDGFKLNVFCKNVLYTDAVVLFDNITVGQEDISFNYIWHEDHTDKAITSLKLYLNNVLVEEIDANTNIIMGLLSNTTYTLIAEYTNKSNSESIYLEFTTLSKTIPQIEIINPVASKTDIIFDIFETDADNIGEIIEIKLIHENGEIIADNTDVRDFANLTPDTDYCLFISYEYDLNDGYGVQTYYITYDFTTLHQHFWVEATCTEPENCSLCGEIGAAPLGHTNGVEATCTTSQICTVCNVEIVAAFGHTEVIDAIKSPTCTETGLTAGKHCSVCNEILEAQETIDALGHTEVVDAALVPTCTTTGLTIGKHCSVCNEILEAQETIDALGHTEVVDAALVPTCTTTGLTIGKHCSMCNEILEAQETIDALGHTEVVDAAVAPTCTETGLTKGMHCSVCNEVLVAQNEVAALGHDLTAANCSAGNTCKRDGCSYSEGKAIESAHILTISYASATPVYSCSVCDYSFKLDTFDYNNGSNYNGLHCNAYTNNTVYTTNGSNYPVQKDGYLEFVRTDAEAGAQKQLLMWLPYANGGTNKFSGFSAASNSIGYLSFKVNAKTDVNFEMKLVDHRVDTIGDTNIRWSDLWAIHDPVFRVMPASNGKAEIRGFNGFVIGTFDVDADGYTGWVDVAIQITLDPETDKVIASYYVNGNYAGTQSRDLTTHTDAIQAVYINFNSKEAGCGYKIDDIVFGYTGHAHNLELSYVNNTAVLACVCGATYTLETEYVEWNGDGNDSGFNNLPNGNVELSVNAAGQYEYIFKPYTDTAPDFSASGTQSGDGWYEYSNMGYAGGQLNMWLPSANRGEDTFSEFSCDNNAVGVISFKMKTNMARHPNFDTSLTFAVGKPRGASDWSDSDGDGKHDSWTDDSINIFTVEEYQESGVVVKGGLNGINLNLATIPVDGNGWSEWFDVTIVIEMTDNGYMTVYYYINGMFLGSDYRDLNNPAGNRTLNPKKIEALWISGWTYAPNTGIIFDDFVFGYTVGGHNTLDGKVHNITPASCTSVEKCSCGWEGTEFGHEFAVPCAPTCSICGLVNENAVPHNIVSDGDKLVCTVCNDYSIVYTEDA